MKDPTYHSLGDHSEAVRIVYDPAVISFADLLALFWKSHNPCHASPSRQYRSAVFYHSPEQREPAEQSLARERKKRSSPVLTEIAPLGTFYPAEEYHQKYYLRSHPALLRELSRFHPEFTFLRTTTVAARSNGFLAGHLTREEFRRELRELGLAEEDVTRILHAAGASDR